MSLSKPSLREKRTHNKGIAASRARRCYLRLQFAISFGCGLDKHLWAFVFYLLLLYLYSSAVGVGHSNEFPACSNTRPLAASYFQTLDAKVLFKNKSCLVQYFQPRCRSFFLRHNEPHFNRAGCKQFLF